MGEALSPERRDAGRDGFGPLEEEERPIARGERQDSGKEKERIAVVMELDTIAKEHVQAEKGAPPKRSAPPVSDRGKRRQEKRRRKDGRINEPGRNAGLGNKGDVECVAEVADRLQFPSGAERLPKDHEPQRHPNEPERVRVAQLRLPSFDHPEHRRPTLHEDARPIVGARATIAERLQGAPPTARDRSA